MASAYTLACVVCERVARIRTPENIPSSMIVIGQKKATHSIDVRGFAACKDDTILFTICWRCETEREHGSMLEPLRAAAGTVGSGERVVDSRLTNPPLAKSLLDRWILLQRLREHKETPRLGSNQEARPVLRIKFISDLLNWGKTPNQFEVLDIMCFKDISVDKELRSLSPKVDEEEFLFPEE